MPKIWTWQKGPFLGEEIHKASSWRRSAKFQQKIINHFRKLVFVRWRKSTATNVDFTFFCSRQKEIGKKFVAWVVACFIGRAISIYVIFEQYLPYPKTLKLNLVGLSSTCLRILTAMHSIRNPSGSLFRSAWYGSIVSDAKMKFAKHLRNNGPTTHIQ